MTPSDTTATSPREDGHERCGAYNGKYDVVCARWLDHDGSHRSRTVEDDGTFSFVQWNLA